MLWEKMLVAESGGYQPNAVKFDGANDYLTRGADLTSAADSKSGIFSAWIRLDGGDATLQTVLANLLSSARFSVTRTAANKFRFLGKNSAGTNILDQATTATYLASAKWVHVLAAWDLAATTAYIYINDTADVTSTTKTNDTIDYVTATPNWSIGSETDGTNKSYAGIAELYFAPGQYLDLSNSTNRRKFIDASGLPVSLGSDGSTPTGSQPAIYLKGDSAAFGANSGSGGNFTVNGTLEKASTTPATLPAYNAVYFDGTSDYLSKASNLTGVSDSRTGIISAWIRKDASANAAILVLDNTGNGLQFLYDTAAIWLQLSDSSGTNYVNCDPSSPTGDYSQKWHHAIFAWDLNNTSGDSRCVAYFDGVKSSITFTGPYANTAFDIGYVRGSPNVQVGRRNTTLKLNGAISEFYFAPGQYLDLSVQANREKFILNGAPVSLGSDGSTPTGVAPAIYLPNRAALVGTNAGSGGNFTINGAPKDANSTPVYYYAEPATFDGTNDYLTRGADLTGIADGKAGTVSFWMRLDGAAATLQRVFANLAGTLRFHVSRNASNKFVVTGVNSAAATILLLTSNSSYSTSAVWVHVLASWDLAATTGYLYINNTSDLAGGPTLTNDTIDYVTASANWAVGADTDGTDKMFATIADIWFSTTYLDISNSANRAKFIDQTTLRPVPLGAKGELPTGSQPLLYLGRDYSNFQTNLGSGGAFTVTGTLTRGTTSPSDVEA